MTRRSLFAVLASMVMRPLHALAHEGHEHKVLGTVTMAAAGRVMLTDQENKTLTIYLTPETRILRTRKVMKIDDIKPRMRVVVTAVTVKEHNVEKLIARQIELGAVQATR